MRNVVMAMLLIAAAACQSRYEKAANVANTAGGNSDRGKELVQQYGCNSCHVIPGIDGPRGMVGPSLEHIASRQIIAGNFQNNPQTLLQWIQNPQGMNPQSAMPNLGIPPADARDITAYLYTLK